MPSDPRRNAILTPAGAERLGVPVQPVTLALESETSASDVYAMDGERIGGVLSGNDGSDDTGWTLAGGTDE
jgi:hypothetical protein